MYLIFKHTPENVLRHNRSTKGWEFISTAESTKDFYNQIEKSDNENFFSQDDGTVTDQDGNEVFDPKYPNTFEFGDYSYHLEEVADLNKMQIKAIEQSSHWNKDEVLAEIND